MKKLLAFALTAGLSLSLFAADIFKYAPITGNVKAYTETDFTIATRFGTLYRTPSSKIMHIFDSNGKETTSSELTPKDAVINTSLQLTILQETLLNSFVQVQTVKLYGRTPTHIKMDLK